MADNLNLALLKSLLPNLHARSQAGDENAQKELVRVIDRIERLEERSGSHKIGKDPDELKSFGTESDDACPEALVELSRLECLPQYHKRRNTILSLVTAHLAGVSEETVWQKGATCSRNTWHTKWKHDRLTMEVLKNVERLTREFQDGATLRALRLAAEMLAMASPAAAQQLIEVSAHGRMRSLMDDKTVYERVGAADAVRASLGVLDRAGVETAPKQPVQVGLTPELQAMIEKVYGSDDGG